MSQPNSPFRSLPWPLAELRGAIRYVRIQSALRRAKLRGTSTFEYGEHVSLGKGADIRPPHYIILGHHVSLGKNFTCEVDTRVGNHVLISSNVSFIGGHHPFDDPSVTIYEAPRKEDDVIEIGNDVFVGFGSTIIGSATIGDGCVIGARSVVSKDLPPYTICAGVPAKPIRARYAS